jgi:hypothetical protein
MFCGKNLAHAYNNNNNKNNESQIFKVKHNILKGSLHGQLWSDFEKVSLKISGRN